MKDIHELISLILEVAFIPLVFSSISQTSRVRAVEKYNPKLMSMVDLMYLEIFLPHSFWDYAVIIASYILNNTLNSSGLKLLSSFGWDTKRVWSLLFVWGCEVYPHVNDEGQYDKNMERCFLIGYP